MRETFQVFPYDGSYLDQALGLIASSDSTNRTKESWLGLEMSAMLAFRQSEAVGIIPFEKRNFLLGNQSLKVLWISGAHVNPEYRRQGIGTEMDKAIHRHFPDYDAVFAFRSDEGSDAYRWYRRIGYNSLQTIVSYQKKVVSDVKLDSLFDIQIWEDEKEILKNEKEIYRVFHQANQIKSGFVERDPHFWQKKLRYHYYKAFYRYSVVSILVSGKMVAYAFLGETEMKDKVKRFDILEMIVPEDEKIKNALFLAIFNFAAKQKLNEVRIQLAEKDPMNAWIQKLGFKERWRTFLLGRSLNGSLEKVSSSQLWRHFQFDYV